MSTKAGVLHLEKGPMQTKKTIAMPIWLKALIALLPALFFLLVFTIFPIFNTAFIAFVKDFYFQSGTGSFALASYFRQLDMHNNPDWWREYFATIEPDVPFLQPVKPIIGFANFEYVLKDPLFSNALINTAILTIISVPLTIMISLLLAVSLNSIKPLRATYQTIFFLPYVTNGIALGMVFNTIFSHEVGGIMNQFIQFFGGKPVSWIRPLWSPEGTIPLSKFSLGFAITVQSIWSGLAFKILVFMAGLASIDKQYYDAARIDGSSRSTIFRRITVPLLSPQILYITITSFIGAFKAYQSVISIVGGGPIHFGGENRTMWITVVGYIYMNRNVEKNIPLAAAGSVVLLIVILFITLIQMQVSKKRVHY